MKSTEFQIPTTTKLTRIAKLSQRDSNKPFHSLMHHYNVDSLRECFQELDGKKAPGNVWFFSCVKGFVLSLVPKLGTLGSNEGGVWVTGPSTLS